MRKFAIIHTEYTLLFYMLINRQWRDTEFFFCYRRVSQDILRRFHRAGGKFFGGYALTLPTNGMSRRETILKRIARRIRVLIAKVFFYIYFFKEKKDNWRIYGHEMLYPSQFFLNHGWQYYVLEDGTASYMPRNQVEELFAQGKFGVHCNRIPNGWSERVKGVILSGTMPVPDGLQRKTQLVNLKEIWSNLPHKEKEVIMSMFGFDLAYWQNVFAEGRDCFLLTGNYYASLDCTKEEQIEIYREILSHYDRKRVIIKNHPGDMLNYKEYFPECMVLETDFPMELFYLTGLPVKKVISIYSSAGISKLLRDDQVDFHVKYLPRLGIKIDSGTLSYIKERIFHE